MDDALVAKMLNSIRMSANVCDNSWVEVSVIIEATTQGRTVPSGIWIGKYLPPMDVHSADP